MNNPGSSPPTNGSRRAWSIETGNKPKPDRVKSRIEDDWYLRCLDEPHHGVRSRERSHHHDGNLLPGQFREHGRLAVGAVRTRTRAKRERSGKLSLP
jgi:hypothetical protein